MKKRTALRSSALAVVVGSIIAICGLTPAYAAGASISPNSQAKTSGSTFTWSLTWSGARTTNSGTFTTGSGHTFLLNGSSATSTPRSWQLLSCTPPKLFNQSLTIFGSVGQVVASATSTATVTAGGFC